MSVATFDLASAFRVDRPARPYPGLRPFETNEWPIFFGREVIAEEVIRRLIDNHLVVIHGDSGCGKSSLVRAAVLPRLEQENARGGIRWHTCASRPGESPLWNLAFALADLIGGDRNERALELRRVFNFGRDAPDALAESLAVGRERHVCLLIDQFEELFDHARRHGPSEAALVAEFLSGMVEAPPVGLYVAVTMRSEYLGACARFPGLAETVNATQYLLPSMTHEEIRRAIREPARLYGGEVDIELADRLIAEAAATADKLPLLQHALMLLHRQEIARGHEVGWRLDRSDYPPGRDLATLLSDHADEVMKEAQQRAGLSSDSRLVEDLFRAITDTNADRNPIRRPQLFKDLVNILGTDERTLRTVIDVFRADGVSFVVSQQDVHDPSRERIDVGHEALLRCWRKISDVDDGWLAREFRNGLVWKSLLVQADSFERNSNNVLAPETMRERKQWMRRRNPHWAARYGGGWERVESLIAASERANAAATVKMRGLQGLVALAVVVIAALAVSSEMDARDAEQRDQENRALLDELRTSNAREAERRAAAENELAANILRLQAALEDVERTAGTEQAVTDALSEVNQTAAQLAATTATPVESARGELTPRIYVQIADSAQREAATRLQRRLAGLQLRGVPITVPGIELVKASPSRTVLRCFRPDECKTDGEELLTLVNNALETPQARLEDLSSRYQNSSSIRDRHFELWIAPGAVQLTDGVPGILIRFYREAERALVERVGGRLGINWELGSSRLISGTTNTLAYSGDITEQEYRNVAVALVEAGFPLRRITQAVRVDEPRLIQIVVSTEATSGCGLLSVEQIRAGSACVPSQ